jgi:hypothetical protein
MGSRPFPLEQVRAQELFSVRLRGKCRASRRVWRLVAGAELRTGKTVGCMFLRPHNPQPMKNQERPAMLGVVHANTKSSYASGRKS